MTSVLAAPSVPLQGSQRPRLESLPPADDWSQGQDAIDLAHRARLDLDEWQRYVLHHALASRGGRHAAFEVGLICSRQNGKGSIIEALELAALYLFDDVELILHSAHKFDTAADAFRRIRGLIEQNPEFGVEVKKIIASHGSESIELTNGKRLRFVARSAGSGRGFASDLVILDEAFNISEDAMASMLPTLSTRPNPQVWYTSTAGGPTSVQLGRVRARGLGGGDPSLAFFEWSVDPDDYDPASEADWALANPGMGIRITPEYIGLERASLSAEAFATERLGVGLYPTDLADAWLVVPQPDWAALVDARSSIPDRSPLAFGVEVTLVAPHRTMAAVSAVGLRRDGRVHVELVDHRRDVDWVVPRLVELQRKHRPCAVVVDPASHAGALIEGLTTAGVETAAPFTARDVATAFGQLRAAVMSGELRHLGQDDLDRSLAGATTRPLSDALAFDRRSPIVDLGPVVSASLALWGLNRYGRGRVAPYDLLKSVS